MELARDEHESQTWHSNRRCSGIAGARVESGCALAWYGRMPSRAARDAGIFKKATGSGARIADATCCGALQQARANRSGWRPLPYDVLKGKRDMQPARRGVRAVLRRPAAER